MEKKEVLAALIDEKKASVLRVLLQNTDELYLKEISQKSNVSIATTYRILQQLTALNILTKREWKTSKVYSCQQNEHVAFLQELFSEEIDGVQEFVKKVQDVPGIRQIIQHGSKKKGKANLLLIGEQIDTERVDEICALLKQQGFELTYLTLGQKQYEQMSKMGLYSGDKKVLK